MACSSATTVTFSTSCTNCNSPEHTKRNHALALLASGERARTGWWQRLARSTQHAARRRSPTAAHAITPPPLTQAGARHGANDTSGHDLPNDGVRVLRARVLCAWVRHRELPFAEWCPDSLIACATASRSFHLGRIVSPPSARRCSHAREDKGRLEELKQIAAQGMMRSQKTHRHAILNSLSLTRCGAVHF